MYWDEGSDLPERRRRVGLDDEGVYMVDAEPHLRLMKVQQTWSMRGEEQGLAPEDVTE